ncbi:alpha/beta hydrolase [Micromonospora sp. KC606]|uniref:alpha/beta hydrolase family protein n=1 Tax=Micromonospora sp. KC606 TaxID=2530379 RepID=UPI001A9EE0B7|nr:alpha/beta hydrolase [Micromonospora sp. KC606]
MVTAALTVPVVAASSSVAAPAGVAAFERTHENGTHAAASRFALPRPTGPFAVGRDVLHLVDRDRPDPWVPANPRELMVSVYYPARPNTGGPARYLTVAEARLFIEDRSLAGVTTPEEFSATRASARTGAHPIRGRYPLVVLSPGFSVYRHTLTHLAEDLASRGYVVAAVDHTYESAGTELPGGRVVTCLACTAVDGQGRDGFARVASGRATDVTFVLNKLTGPRRAWRHADLIDRTRIGMAGHSIGGNAAASTMAADPRVLAGVNMDGTFFAPVPEDGLGGRPFLMLGHPGHVPGGPDDTWDRDWLRLDGCKHWLTVTGTAHIDFSDLSVLADQAGLPDDASPLSGERTAEIMRTYVGAFLDRHLRGIHRPVLDGPTPGNPEVVFHQP